MDTSAGRNTDTTARGPHTSPGYWLHHAALVWRQVCESGLGQTTYPQFNVLSAVSLLTGRDGSAPTQQQVADFARMDRMMASKVIRVLQDRALLVRAPDPHDARRQRLVLTEQGRSALRTCIDAARKADEEVFGSGPEVEVLREALRAIAERR
ncbi:MAG: winged helix-turn-helix transcriptional regulator [Catenulispora sp.]|nr:winged helix-turn-helix transcriptional regulator [Catenulispora sp.]